MNWRLSIRLCLSCMCLLSVCYPSSRPSSLAQPTCLQRHYLPSHSSYLAGVLSKNILSEMQFKPLSLTWDSWCRWGPPYLLMLPTCIFQSSLLEIFWVHWTSHTHFLLPCFMLFLHSMWKVLVQKLGSVIKPNIVNQLYFNFWKNF